MAGMPAAMRLAEGTRHGLGQGCDKGCERKITLSGKLALQRLIEIVAGHVEPGCITNLGVSEQFGGNARHVLG